jgi:hypothetical protein
MSQHDHLRGVASCGQVQLQRGHQVHLHAACKFARAAQTGARWGSIFDFKWGDSRGRVTKTGVIKVDS